MTPHGMPVIPDGPTTFHYAYASDSVAPREPRPPVPYRTFSETFSYCDLQGLAWQRPTFRSCEKSSKPRTQSLDMQGLRPCHKDVSQLRKERIYVHH